MNFQISWNVALISVKEKQYYYTVTISFLFYLGVIGLGIGTDFFTTIITMTNATTSTSSPPTPQTMPIISLVESDVDSPGDCSGSIFLIFNSVTYNFWYKST